MCGLIRRVAYIYTPIEFRGFRLEHDLVAMESSYWRVNHSDNSCAWIISTVRMHIYRRNVQLPVPRTETQFVYLDKQESMLRRGANAKVYSDQEQQFEVYVNLISNIANISVAELV